MGQMVLSHCRANIWSFETFSVRDFFLFKNDITKRSLFIALTVPMTISIMI